MLAERRRKCTKKPAVSATLLPRLSRCQRHRCTTSKQRLRWGNQMTSRHADSPGKLLTQKITLPVPDYRSQIIGIGISPTLESDSDPYLQSAIYITSTASQPNPQSSRPFRAGAPPHELPARRSEPLRNTPDQLTPPQPRSDQPLSQAPALQSTRAPLTRPTWAPS